MNTLSFSVGDAKTVGYSGPIVLPVVDGVPLSDLVHDFETAQGWSPANSYSGLVIATYRYGLLEDYFHGHGYPMSYPNPCALLVCGCGQMSCWPLMALIHLDVEQVVWDHFAQPHRPQWDYGKFGPFAFDREQYDEALLELPLSH